RGASAAAISSGSAPPRTSWLITLVPACESTRSQSACQVPATSFSVSPNFSRLPRTSTAPRNIACGLTNGYRTPAPRSASRWWASRACRYVVPVLGSPTCRTTRVIGGRGRVMTPSWQRARVAFAHVSTSPSRVYVARLVGLPIFDPQGDQVGKVRDLVVAIRSEASQPRVLGMVAEVFGRRRIFVPMTRVTNIDSGQVYTTGLLNMRRFEQRSTETLVVGQLFDRTVTITASGVTGTVYDVAMEQARNRDWVLSRVAIQEPTKTLRRRGQTHVVEWRDVEGLTQREESQGATHLIAALNEMRAADAASMLHDLPFERRSAVVAALDDERLADVLEE